MFGWGGFKSHLNQVKGFTIGSIVATKRFMVPPKQFISYKTILIF